MKNVLQSHQNPSYPSHDVTREEKLSNEWMLQYSEAFMYDYGRYIKDNVQMLRMHSDQIRLNRKYGAGRQSEKQYQEFLTIKSNNGKPNVTYRNLDYANLRVMPRIVEVLHSKILNRNRNIFPKPIDAYSISKEKEMKAQYLEYVANSERAEQLQAKYNVTLPSPGEPKENMPQRVEDVETHLKNLNFKNQYSLEMKDYIDTVMLYNNWEDLKNKLVNDLTHADVVATKVWIDQNGILRMRRGVPENMITNNVKEVDFSDLIRVGEFYQQTMTDLKNEQGRYFTDMEYQEIEQQASAYHHNQRNGYQGEQGTDDEANPYDHERIQCLDIEFFSFDKEVSVVKTDEKGVKNIYDKKITWNPHHPETKKKMTDKEYEEFYDKKRKVIRSGHKNVYTCTWIVGTKYTYNRRLVSDMGKVHNKLHDAKLSWVFDTSNFEAIVEKCENIIDQMQINWLQHQHHSASSRPPGIAIEKHALAKTQKGGTEKFDPIEAIKMYAETGSIIYDGYDYQGKPLSQVPFKELANGMNDDALKHLELVFRKVELIRYVTGLNQVTEGSQPENEISRYIADAMNFGTDNSLDRLYKTFDRHTIAVAKRIADLCPDALKRDHNGLSDSIGVESKNFLKLAEKKGLIEFGIDLEIGLDIALKQKIMESVEKEAQEGKITSDQKIMILQEDNPYTMRQLLKRAIDEREALNHAKEMEKMQMQEQVNTASTNAAIQLEMQKANAEAEAKMRVIEFEKSIEEEMNKSQFKRDYMLETLRAKQKLNETELQETYKLLGIEAEGNNAMELAEFQAENAQEKPENKD